MCTDKAKEDVIRKWKRFFMFSCFSCLWLSGPTRFSIVPLHLALGQLVGYYWMDSSVTVCSTVSWRLPAPLASALRCRYNMIASGFLVIITSLQEMEMVTLTCCLCQVTRTACQPSLSKMRLFVCRHGERMDVVFGKHWVAQCFDSKGQHAVVD